MRQHGGRPVADRCHDRELRYRHPIGTVRLRASRARRHSQEWTESRLTRRASRDAILHRLGNTPVPRLGTTVLAFLIAQISVSAVKEVTGVASSALAPATLAGRGVIELTRGREDVHGRPNFFA